MATPADKLDNAFRDYAHSQGDGFSKPDWIGAYDYREEGYAIAVEAFGLPADDRADFIEYAVSEHPESAQYLVACAADFRMAELASVTVRRIAA